MFSTARDIVDLHKQLSEESVMRPDRTISTPAGPLFLQSHCSSSLVERLRADSGLRAFARLPEREYALLLDLARRSDCSLALAYTPGGEIVGQVTLAPADGWWEGLANVYEGAIEVSIPWRELGIARQLLTLVSTEERLEQLIVLAMGLSWHWDTEGLKISKFRYRELIERLFAPYGFAEYQTSEANIQMDPANILLARFGSNVAEETMSKFFCRLFQSDTLPGW